jgi:hypothetical protein
MNTTLAKIAALLALAIGATACETPARPVARPETSG